MKEYVLETNGLTKRYGSAEALSRADIRVEKGAIYGLVGNNGAGKTRLMNLILDDLRRFTNGEKTESCIMVFEGTDQEEQERLFVFYSQELENRRSMQGGSCCLNIFQTARIAGLAAAGLLQKQL